MAAVTCKTCEAGTLQPKKKYRMSGVVVVIGYILLVPSVLGILFSAMMLFASGSAGSSTFEQIEKQAKTQMAEAGVPTDIADKVATGGFVAQADIDALPDKQKSAVEAAKISVGAGKAGAGAGTALMGGGSICMGISCLVGGLLGWLLVMKRKVLVCSNCSAAVDAA